jgi:hypothetical protein
MILNEKKKQNQKSLSQVGCPDWSQNSKFKCFTAMWTGKCPTQQLFEATWNQIVPNFSFIIVLLMSQSFFLPVLQSHSPKMNNKAFEKINFISYFSPILEHCFLYLIFHIHFLGPILHHLTKSHDSNFVFQSSGIQNYKQPLYTVYPLYKSIDSKDLKLNTAIYIQLMKGMEDGASKKRKIFCCNE